MFFKPGAPTLHRSAGPSLHKSTGPALHKFAGPVPYKSAGQDGPNPPNGDVADAAISPLRSLRFAAGATLAVAALGVFAAMAAVGESAAAQEPPAVAVTIKPAHSLVAMVMDGIGVPDLIVTGAGSPHGQSLKPSQARTLQRADLVFWIGADLERFLADPIANLANEARVVALSAVPGLRLLPVREAGPMGLSGDGHDEAHEHTHGDDAHHEAHEHTDSHDDHDEAHEHGDGDDDHDDAHMQASGPAHRDHEHAGFDTHVWLDPENAKLMIGAIAGALAAADPGRAGRYRDNARVARARLDALASDLDGLLAPVKGRPYMVFHDAYRYFEERFGLPVAGAILVNPEILPGARRIAALKERIRSLGAVCVFSEPQFQTALVDVLVEGTGAKVGVLDPIGARIAAGPDHYAAMMQTMAHAFRDCLSGNG